VLAAFLKYNNSNIHMYMQSLTVLDLVYGYSSFLYVRKCFIKTVPRMLMKCLNEMKHLVEEHEVEL